MTRRNNRLILLESRRTSRQPAGLYPNGLTDGERLGILQECGVIEYRGKTIVLNRALADVDGALYSQALAWLSVIAPRYGYELADIDTP